MNAHITFIYTALLAVVFTVLSLRVIRLRRGKRVSLGDGGIPVLGTAIRVHGNFAEYVPISLILLLGLEMLQYPPFVLHGFGLLLILSRLCHAYGLSSGRGVGPARTVGMVTTLTLLLGGAVLVLFKGIFP